MFDVDAIKRHRWCQGAILGPGLVRVAREGAPREVVVGDDDWLIVTSHHCDVVNNKLEKEPFVEVLRAEVVKQKAPNNAEGGGRSPRVIQLLVEDGINTFVLSCKVHERWTLPRENLAAEAPVRCLDEKNRRLLAEWLAKRYIRAAFPSAFDDRWRFAMDKWRALLKKHSRWVQGVYLRLNTDDELETGVPYRCDLIVAVPVKMKRGAANDWPDKKDELERVFSDFWRQFEPDIELDVVDVLATDDLTLDDIESYQRFDADWISFADESATTPPAADMTA